MEKCSNLSFPGKEIQESRTHHHGLEESHPSHKRISARGGEKRTLVQERLAPKSQLSKGLLQVQYLYSLPSEMDKRGTVRTCVRHTSESSNSETNQRRKT